MFGSSIVDVVLGVVFTFLAVSLAASAITEAIASLLKLRQATLLDGMKALLNDPDFTGLVRELYAHALVNPLSSATKLTTKPAYIEARNFAMALHDVLQARAPDKPIADVVAGIPDPQLRQAMQALLVAAEGGAARFQIEVAAWFDAAMARLGGWYKRRTQAVSFAVAFAVAAILNADALHVTAVLWSRPALAGALAAGLRSDGAGIGDLLGRLDSATLIGWAAWQADPRNNSIGILLMLSGWSVVAAASLFGAPFWFDALQRITSIRGTGAPVHSGAGGAGAGTASS